MFAMPSEVESGYAEEQPAINKVVNLKVDIVLLK